jgi:hypothetical protein
MMDLKREIAFSRRRGETELAAAVGMALTRCALVLKRRSHDDAGPMPSSAPVVGHAGWTREPG